MRNIKEILPDLTGKKIAIDDVVTTYSHKLSSHKSAHPEMFAHQLKGLGLNVKVLSKSENIHDYDTWIVVLPIEFNGSFNIFGGASDETAERIKRFIDFKGDIYIINREFPDVAGLVDQRMKTAGTLWKTLDSNLVRERAKKVESIEIKLFTGTLVIGDSHSVSCWEPGADINRQDGSILYSVLRDGIENRITGYGTIKRLVSYFGNIDIRHHICRQPDPIAATKKLAATYIEKIAGLDIADKNIVKLLPIEWEGRRIPGTGFYKKTPFYGSQQLRSQCVEAFNKTLDELAKDNGINIIEWPKQWYEMDPQLYADTYMEKPGSVHLSREYYQWDWVASKKNEKLEIKIPFVSKEKTETKLKINTLF